MVNDSLFLSDKKKPPVHRVRGVFSYFRFLEWNGVGLYPIGEFDIDNVIPMRMGNDIAISFVVIAYFNAHSILSS